MEVAKIAYFMYDVPHICYERLIPARYGQNLHFECSSDEYDFSRYYRYGSLAFIEVSFDKT